MKIRIKNATIVNARENSFGDILITDGRVAEIEKGNKSRVDKEIDAKNKVVLPGLIDLHAHLRTPGREDEEDLLSGSRAAAKGGFTTLLCMPNTTPAIDNEGVVKWIEEENEKLGIITIHPIAALTQGRKGEVLTEFGILRKAGCRWVSDDGDSLEKSSLFRRAAEYAKMFDMVIFSHCEDPLLSLKGAMRECFLASKYGVNAVPDIAETVRVYRDVAIAKYIGCRLHLTHISSAKSIDLIRQEKKTFPLLSCETAPHYLLLTVDDIVKSGFDSNFKVNPPLGESKDAEALLEAIQEGVVDSIGTDHAPHSLSEKELPFEEAACGVIGLETAFSSLVTAFVKKKKLTLNKLVALLSTNPARIAGLPERGCIKVGSRADLIVVDLDVSWKVIDENLFSKSKNTPLKGQELFGCVDYTIHNGTVSYCRQE